MAKVYRLRGAGYLSCKEMIRLDDIFALGQRANVMRLWRAWHESTQANLAKELGVHSACISALERWGLAAMEGEYGEKYREDFEKALEGLRRWGVTPEDLGLQFEGLPTRYSKKKKDAD